MKKFLKRLLISFISIVSIGLASCGITSSINDSQSSSDSTLDNEYSKGLRYELIKNEYYQVWSIGNCTDLDIVIPETYNNLPVKSIRAFAFNECENLLSVVIPDSVTYIGIKAFYGCKSLTDITLSDSVTVIEYSAFEDTAYYNDESNWENEVLYIGKSLIKAKNTIKGVYEIKDDTICIADSAFRDCTSLTIAVLHDSITSIGQSAFSGCTGLTTVDLSDSITYIGDQAFVFCTSLTSVDIPASVTSIGHEAFWACASLTIVNIPASVTSIGYRAFSACESLISITVNKDNPNYKDIDGNLYTKDGKTFIQYAIGKTATSFTISDSITSIGESAFERCISLTDINMPDTITSIEQYAFSNTGYYNNESNWENGVLYVGKYLIKAKKDTITGAYTIKDGTLCIAEGAFLQCDGLESVIIPDSVTYIGNSAFTACHSLKNVEIGCSVKSFWGPFFGCTRLEGVTFKNTEGWKVTNNEEQISLFSEDLADASKAITYLKYTYADYIWTREE